MRRKKALKSTQPNGIVHHLQINDAVKNVLIAFRLYFTRRFLGSCTPTFTAALFPIARTRKQPKYLSIDEWPSLLKMVTQISLAAILGRRCLES